MKLHRPGADDGAEAEFPGEIAGASLKPRRARDPRARRRAEFPGEIAGASLKLADRLPP